jgi:hypothetical protein
MIGTVVDKFSIQPRRVGEAEVRSSDVIIVEQRIHAATSGALFMVADA